jgi:hypothetical protein
VPLLLVEVGLFPGMGCMVPQPYATRGSRPYLGVLGYNQWPAVPGDEDMPFMDTTTSSCNDTKTSFKYKKLILMFQLF